MSDFNGRNIDTSGDAIKLCSFAAYLGPLFLIGLIYDRLKTPSLKFHINQGIVLFMAEIAFSIVSTILSYIPFVGGTLSWIIGTCGSIACIVLIAIGFYHVIINAQRELPYIGFIKIIK